MIQKNNVSQILSAHELARLRAVLKICQLIEGTAVMLCAVDKAGLRSAIGYQCKNGKTGNVPVREGADGIVSVNKDHAPHVEFGTQPHIITVKNARVLSDGKQVFGTRVYHPGTAAQPFMRPAMDQNQGNINIILKNELGEIAR